MTIALHLLEEGRVLKLDIASPWSLDDLLRQFDKAQQYFDESSGRIDTLVDISNMKSIPPGVLRVRTSPFLSHPNSGYQIIVGANTYAKAMADTLFRLANYKRVRFYTSMDEAWAFLRTVELSPAE